MGNTINASIITIGDELLIGQTIDTNSAFIGQELNKIGIWVRRRVAVGDVWDDIVNALDEESRISKLIIITGGLGPTADDITKPLLAEYFGGKLVVDENVLAHVKYLFEKVYRRPGPILERNLKQAEVPDVATVLHNTWGSAPGMLFKKNDAIFISLPGVPHEMKGLMQEQVIPYLLQHMVLQAIVHRTAFTFGQGESMIAEKLVDFEASLPAHIKLAYLPGYGMVKLRLTSKGPDKELVEKELLPYFEELKTRVSEFLVSGEDEPLEVVIGKILSERNQTVATAESCTGGYIAHLITSVAGSSAHYKGSVVSYANAVKQDLLHVNEETLRQFGAVSQETVKEMAAGALQELKTDYALAISGIMGPGGGSEEKPVGTVWIAVAGRGNVITHKLNLRFDRQRNIMMATANALNLLRKFILTNT
ncbi:competence/damage-inducible protein A [Terrimonas sp. NA20]|uniref:CinA-like protein n=1 Tax=Terrimonas ginsenosidimutans TaxID=2908004 RepID=A0ABS9KYI6_9BACT|nr:competence/damage-inducible protein A [Terrimonas ginsenosidimutans]MCG2617385.1 competence/damage-inducible protein A [Terrimonas ginsenosidimutans]